MKRSSYQSLTIKKKLEIIDRVEDLPSGKRKKDIAAEYNIPCSTLSTILKNKDSLRGNHAIVNSKKKRQKDPTMPEVDEALFQWFTAARAQSIPISGEVLKTMAEEMSQKKDPQSDWKCSSGWLSRWKERHNVSYRSVCGENASVNQEVCTDWKENVLQPLLEKYSPDDVFNADETGLYWRLLPDKTHAVVGEKCTGGKLSKERVTALVCANMSGTEKRPLFVIGKFKKPRCFRGVHQLPVEYDANKSAWMTSTIFETWLRRWDASLTRKDRKIVLFVDNCNAHPHVKDLNAIDLVFLPPNTTSEIQPCDQGIIKTLKTYYRRNMVANLICAINSGESMADFSITLLDGLQMLRVAWSSVTSRAIENCFRKAGFHIENTESCQIEEEPDQEFALDELNLKVPCTFDDYVVCDEEVQCCPMPAVDDILESLTNDKDDNDEDDHGEELPSITYQEAQQAFSTIQAYLLQSSEPPYSLLQKLASEVTKHHTSTLIQPKITDYFKRQ